MKIVFFLIPPGGNCVYHRGRKTIHTDFQEIGNLMSRVLNRIKVFHPCYINVAAVKAGDDKRFNSDYNEGIPSLLGFISCTYFLKSLRVLFLAIILTHQSYMIFDVCYLHDKLQLTDVIST